MLLEIDKNNESTITNADSNVYMKYMSDFIIYLYTMDKLIELLNEYDGEDLEYGFIDGEIRRKVRNFDDERNTWKQVVWYTKQFGFIKRLVENNKIDIFKSGIDELPRMFGYDYESVECKSDRLVMMLSIQNDPIKFLVKILK